ncbi:pilus assembly protein TadG-related protein [Massilia consociata]|uniref:Pilus assembly protein TadG-related protein n=2 Tax=Massilia consociata TaxID=760117 RepID=A0ABV6FK42_9BURK
MAGAGQAGQALVLCLLFAGAAALVSLLLFNSGMLANTKTQLQNAADAGAYSGAVMLARDHNFSAYANRAMVANQVAVAQLVSLDSYLEDAASTHARLNDLVQHAQSLIPRSKPSWNAGKRSPIERVNTAYGKLGGPAVKSLNRLVRAFENAQRLHHTATAANVMFIVNEVIQKNDPQASLSTGMFQSATTLVQIDKWKNDYTKEYRANDSSSAADRFANVVVDEQSTDAFTRNRRSIPLPAWSGRPTALSCLLIGQPVNTTFGFVHGGGTILSSDKRRWLALDASMGAGVHVCRYYVPFVGVVYTTLPLIDPSSHGFGGSGGAVAGRGGAYGESSGFSGNPGSTNLYGYSLVIAAIPAGVRYLSKGPGASLDVNGGLQDSYRDLADLAHKPVNQSPELNGGQTPLTVEVERPASSVRTSSAFLGGASNLRLDPALKGATMRSLSSAHAFFYRPKQNSSAFTRTGWQRADNRAEMANLFNPYWQARLRDPSLAERAASFGAQ